MVIKFWGFRSPVPLDLAHKTAILYENILTVYQLFPKIYIRIIYDNSLPKVDILNTLHRIFQIIFRNIFHLPR